MFKPQYELISKSALIAGLLFGLSINPSVAQSSAQDIARILADGSPMEVTALKHAVIVTIPVEATVTQDAMRTKALACVRKLSNQQVEEIEFVFKNKTNDSTQEISFDQAEIRAITNGGQPARIEIAQGQKVSVQPATTGVYVQTQVAPKFAPTQTEYQTQRAEVASQLKALEQKGVGIGAFVNELKRLDNLYSHAQLAEATDGLTKLAANAKELEARRQEAQTTSHTSHVQQVRPGSQRTAHAGQSSGNIASYTGSVDGFVDSIVNEIAQRELGGFIPKKGPFLVERFRIARRLHELENQHVRVDGPAQLYRQMEDLVASRDSRRMPEIGNDVRYLQQQLGLTQLEGSLHRSISL